ncbi:alpha/beta fold hydrolase [Herminiimonas arsenitoxidans]|uniref:alpha/beta fold hydrolase n=1 Tax=Herminiimonas arsenitoxidans TaxID=1809410 RepID=UPI001E627CD3|nr:alpha/beta fold hydrolase [Herminiimonas arsenitoxidans]
MTSMINFNQISVQQDDPMDVVCRGDGAVTIVALHGIQGTRASWQPVTEALGDQVRWVLPNMRGRGQAFRGHGDADYSLDEFAKEIAKVITRYVTTPRYVLAGWSMGVSVTLATMALLKEQGVPLPQALILMSGSPVLQQTSWFHATEHGALLQEITAREQRLGLRDAADRDAVAWSWQSISQSDQRALLPTMDLPVLIVHGSADEDSPYVHAQLLKRGLPQAQLSTIDDAMHSILTQNTARVVDEMRAFLSDLPTLRSSHEK